MRRLRDQMKVDLQLKRFSPKTQKIYIAQVRDFARYFNKSPEQLGKKEVKEYLHYLIRERGVSSLYVNQCQFLKQEKWLEKRKEDLLPVEYFHDELNPLALRNQKVIYNILFRSVSETLIELSRDTKHIGAQIGFISILHTWGQNLMDHPHIHCIVTGGGLSTQEPLFEINNSYLSKLIERIDGTASNSVLARG